MAAVGATQYGVISQQTRNPSDVSLAIRVASLITFIFFSTLLFCMETLICYKLPTAPAISWTLIGGGAAQVLALIAHFSSKKPHWLFVILATIFIANNLLSGGLLLGGFIDPLSFAHRAIFSNLSKLSIIIVASTCVCCTHYLLQEE